MTFTGIMVRKGNHPQILPNGLHSDEWNILIYPDPAWDRRSHQSSHLLLHLRGGSWILRSSNQKWCGWIHIFWIDSSSSRNTACCFATWRRCRWDPVAPPGAGLLMKRSAMLILDEQCGNSKIYSCSTSPLFKTQPSLTLPPNLSHRHLEDTYILYIFIHIHQNQRLLTYKDESQWQRWQYMITDVWPFVPFCSPRLDVSPSTCCWETCAPRRCRSRYRRMLPSGGRTPHKSMVSIEHILNASWCSMDQSAVQDTRWQHNTPKSIISWLSMYSL